MTKETTLPFEKSEIKENLKEDDDEEDFIKDEGPGCKKSSNTVCLITRYFTKN